MTVDRVKRKAWMDQQSALRPMLEKGTDPEKGLGICLSQHAQLHTNAIANEPWSFQDEVLEKTSDTLFRRIPKGMEHSMAWALWHAARIEDTALNILVAGTEMVLDEGGWNAKMGVKPRDTGNAMGKSKINVISKQINLEQLLAYRLAVGKRTQEVIKGLNPSELKQKVQQERLKKLTDEGIVVPNAYGLIEYWGNRTIAGLLLMPATRHNFVHLNEMVKIKKRRM